MSQQDEARLVETIRRQVAGAGLSSGPLVSIVMLNRDGAVHLRRVLSALARTTYRDLELIVVDNASTDASIEILEAGAPGLAIRVIRNATNASFSDGNDQGIDLATGELVLLLNNDVEPIDPSWLGCLVETLLQPDVTAVGARLIFPRIVDQPPSRKFADLSVQHGGVTFRLIDGAPLPVPMRPGSDALDPWASDVRDVPALTAACLLVRRADILAAGGFTTGYDYGQEDIDLCLKLRESGGRLVYDGRAALWHRESSTRSIGEMAERRARVDANREKFVGLWAPRLYPVVIDDAIGAGRWWCETALRVRVAGEMPSGLADPLRAFGWTLTERADADVLLVTGPDVDLRPMTDVPISVALASEPVDRWLACPWLADFDVVLATSASAMDALADAAGTVSLAEGGADGLARTLATAVRAWVRSPRVGIVVSTAGDADGAGTAEDMSFARGLQRAFERAGHPTRIHPAERSGSWTAARDPVSVQVGGEPGVTVRPGQAHVVCDPTGDDEIERRATEVLVTVDRLLAEQGPAIAARSAR